MKPEVFLIIILFVSVIAVILYIRGRKIDSKIMATSKKIESILELNQSFVFHDIHKAISISKHYDNKSNYNRIEPEYLMSAHIRNDLSKFSRYISKIRDNRENKVIYDKKVSVILSQPMETKQQEFKISLREYKHREKKLLNKTIIRPVINCRLCVHMSYSSPKGKVNLSKSRCFSFDDIFTSFESVSRTYLDKQTYSKLATVERGEISDSLRYDILNRDGFRCVICGASSQEGVRLHVDHIIPVSKGGKSIPSNLRTLCERCNIGKSDKLEEELVVKVPSKVKESLICPICGSELVLRKGRNGDFYGCSSYPKCKYTKKV